MLKQLIDFILDRKNKGYVLDEDNPVPAPVRKAPVLTGVMPFQRIIQEPMSLDAVRKLCLLLSVPNTSPSTLFNVVYEWNPVELEYQITTLNRWGD